jgi:hypothetical protein
MNAVKKGAGQWIGSVRSGWEHFWFLPDRPHTLALIRILAGSLFFYTHLVWALDLNAFLGAEGWIPPSLSREMHEGTWTWSYLWYLESSTMLWIAHILTLVVFAMLTVGLLTRAMSVLAWIIVISYCNRLEGMLFGLDQFNAMMAFYLMIGPSGAVYSLDHWLRRRRQGTAAGETVSLVSANIAIRLIQLHMCIIYLFGGIGKMRGDTWWDGSAFWYAVALGEYQSMDMTWLVDYPWLIALLSHVTVFWETFYCVIVWPRTTRPITLAIAFGVHGGIAAFLGMIPFGVAMIIGNLAFIPSSLTEGAIGWFGKRRAVDTEVAVKEQRGPVRRRRRRGHG